MIIKDMFYKQIDRDIKGVIKVGQADDENVYQELEEYVVTSELETYMNKFFDAYMKGLSGKTDKMGVWISGFFGSGKSHFLKILSYILENKKVADENGKEHSASSFFTEGVKVQSSALKKKIEKIAEYSSDVDVILFNVDSKSESDSKMNKEAIRDVFMKVFNDHLGYCGSIPFLADFERKMDMDGVYDSFKNKFEEINGSSWEEAREDYFFIQDEIIESVVSLGIMSEKEANNWTENAQNAYSLSVEKFAKYVKNYCESKGKFHHIVFLVDEIGQYIADDSQLMVNLQTVAEDLGTACEGKAWIAVTSQQDIDSITKTMGNDFSKIQGRFDTRIALSSANVDEVIRKRILYKTDTAITILCNLYEEYESVIKNIIAFSEGTPYMPLYENSQDFSEVYPFIPYQFKLLGNVLTSIRQYSSSGKHMADGERSMLALFKEAAQKYENEREGLLVPFNAFYSALDDFIDHTHRIVITQATANTRLEPFDVEVLKVLFMIKHVGSFKSNAENVTTLMISKITEDTLELRKRVEKSFRLLANEGVVQKNGDEYTFLTNEEQDAENRIREIYVDTKDVVQYVAQVAFDQIIAIPNSKYRYSNRYQFGFNQQIDDRMIRHNVGNPLTLHLLTAYCGKDDDLSLSLLSEVEKSVVVRLADDYAYLSETESMKRIEAFIGKPELAKLTNYEVILINKRKERNDRVKRIEDFVRLALENAQIFVRGEKINSKSKDVAAKINDAFSKLVASEYSKLVSMETAPESSDVMDMLKKSKTQMTLNIPGMKEPNAEALRDLLSEIQKEVKSGKRYSLKQALDRFKDVPFGFTETDIVYLIATLYKKGKISLKMNSVVYTPASTSADDIYKYLTKKEFVEKLLLEIKEVPKPQWIKSVKDVIAVFLGRTVVTDDSDAIMRDFRSFAGSKMSSYQELLRNEYQGNDQLPGKGVLKKAVRLLEETTSINDPMTFYKRVDELFDDFDELVDDMKDVIGFLEGPQKEKFKKACHTYGIYKKSENYISDTQILEYASQVERIIKTDKPFRLIMKLDDAATRLANAIVELLEKDAKKVEPEVIADRKIALEAITKDRPYSGQCQKFVEDKYETILDKISKTNDIASMNGIPAESNALLQNCLNQIQNMEEAYQRSVQPKTPNDNPPVVKPVHTVKTVPVTMRTLTRNKTYTIKNQNDIDSFLSEIRKELEDKLDNDVVIKLN